MAKELVKRAYLKHNDKSQSCCQDVPELQCVTIGYQWMRGVTVVSVSINTQENERYIPIWFAWLPNLMHSHYVVLIHEK